MPRQRIWTLVGLGSAIVTLMLLASGLTRVAFAPGHTYLFGGIPLPTGAPVPAPAVDPRPPGWLSIVVTLLVLASLLYLVIGLILSRAFRRQLLVRAISMLIFIMLAYLVLSALRGNPILGDRPPDATPVPPPPPSAEPFPAFVANPAPWLIIVVSAILAALLIGGIWLLWRRTRVPPPPLTRLADEAQAALANIQAGADLRDAVLRCYREMGQILSEQHGIERPRGTTPREFEEQLAAVGLRDEHIQQLTRLFERVRYGARQANEREEREAVVCLTAIVQAYGMSP
ncbi:MAG TPA: DUF4129 domain-containing protein [Roseiflexaceae bacterium]|jgi:hypothetical protein